jgi:hypothetical protein
MNGLLAVAGVGIFATMEWLPWYLFFAAAGTLVVFAGLRRGY